MLLSVEEIRKRALDLAEAVSPDAPSEPAPFRADQLALEAPRTPEIVEDLERAYAQGISELKAAVLRTLERAQQGSFNLTRSDWTLLLVSARSVSDWQTMIEICEIADAEPEPFISVPAIAQQYAMALNRIGESETAEFVIVESIGFHGADSESSGILGRIYKDRWLNSTDNAFSRGCLVLALNAYWGGVERNQFEIYPAVNTLTLLRCAGVASRQIEPFAIHLKDRAVRRTHARHPDYFDFATIVEVCASIDDFKHAHYFAEQAIAQARAPWELETTALTLKMLIERAYPTVHHDLNLVIARLHEAAASWTVEDLPVRQQLVSDDQASSAISVGRLST